MYKYGMHEPYGARDQIQTVADRDTWAVVFHETLNSPMEIKSIMEQVQFEVELLVAFPLHDQMLRGVW